VAQLSSLMDYYYTSMYPELKVLEEMRLSLLAKLKKVGFTLIIAAFMASFLLIHNAVLTPMQALGLSGAIGGMLFLFVFRHEKAGYESLFKDNVIEKIIHFIDPALVYRKEGCVHESSYINSGLFPKDYDRYQGSDLVEGMVEGVSLRFSDLHVEEKRKTKNNKEEWHTIFQGLFFIADFHKEFRSKTYVLPDIAERSLGVLGSWFQELNHTHGSLIKLDHVQFEKWFVVYGEDEVEAHYILSHAFMERIVAFYEKHHKNLSLGFVDGKMYLALSYTKALFEPTLMRSLLSFTHIKEYFGLLEMIFGIVEEFKLNQKLWSKR